MSTEAVGALKDISFHALREESDYRKKENLYRRIGNFNPRSPRGERPCIYQSTLTQEVDFNPRSP